MVDEVLSFLSIRPGGTYIDGTAGSGGHALAILERAGPIGRVLALDRDEESLDRLRDRLACWKDAFVAVHGNFADMGDLAAGRGVDRADGVLLDLGISSDQLESADRGFSFEADGPLDMRMDRSAGETAADLVNRLSEEELERLLKLYGEEPRARRIARRLVWERRAAPVSATGQLARLVCQAVGGRRGRLHPATRTFQALRIAVNGEIESLERGLEAGLALLTPGGRMVAISFHSLEDRLVKRCFAAHEGRWESLQQGGRAWRGAEPRVKRLTPKPLTPSEAERLRNPRSRSAKLRAVERVGGG